MNTKELVGRLPESIQGNISHSETAVTITLEKGYLKLDKVTQGWGDTELTLDGKELTLDLLKERLGKVELREYVKPPEVEQEASKEDMLAAMTDLNDRVDALESGKAEPSEKTSLWSRIKAVFRG